MSEDKTTTRKLETVDPVTDAQTRALAIANTFREKIGEPQITGIIPGERSSSTNCILARTFNAKCTVGYDDMEGGLDNDGNETRVAEFGWAAFFDREMAEAFRDSVNEHLDPGETLSEVMEQPDGSRGFRASLPSAIAQIAVDFDTTTLSKELYEHNYDQLGHDAAGYAKSASVNEVLGLTA